MISFLIIVGALAGILWPLMRRGFYVSDDGEWMVIRLTAFYQSLADGQFPVRYLGRLNNSYGYPVANFLYPGFLYMGSLLHFFGVSFVTSVKVILMASVVGTAAFLYASVRRVYSSYAATLGTLAFIGSPYLLYDLYTRGSVGEVLAFLPASVGLYSIVADKRWVFALAVGMLVVSHNTLALLFIGVFAVFIIVHRRYGFIWQFLLGLLVSAFFWMPALFEKQYVRFDTVTVSNPVEYLFGREEFWMIGIAGLLSCFVLVFRKVKTLEKTTRVALVFYLISVFFVLPISAFFWTVRPAAVFIQFPYRLLGIGVLMMPWIVAASYEKLKKQKILATIVLLFILLIPSWYLLQKISFVRRDEGYYTTNEATTTVQNEYMPKWVRLVPVSRASERIIFQKGRGTIVYEYLNTQKVVAHVDALDASIIRIQTIYYPGWGITVDGKSVPVAYDNPNGFMEIPIEPGKHAIVAEFRETIPRFVADIVSLSGVLAWIVLVVKSRKN